MFSFICVWINDRVNNRDAGDLRRYRAHYDVIIIEEKTDVLPVYLNIDNTLVYINIYQFLLWQGTNKDSCDWLIN